MSILLFLGLLLSPTHQVDLSVGPSIVEDRAHLVVVPAYHLAHNDLQISLEFPARIQLADLQLRAADFDEPNDYGRIVRNFSIQDVLTVGSLKNLSDTQHVLVSHFFNQIDDAHHRTAIISHANLQNLRGLFFSDQVLGPPILGTFMRYTMQRRTDLHFNFVSDTNRPRMNGGQSGFFTATALGVSHELWRRNTTRWALTSAVAPSPVDRR